MPALIDLRRRIKSVRNTQRIAQAMKTVATAKFKKAQRSVLEARPLWHNYPDLLTRISTATPRFYHPLLEKRVEKKIKILVVTSDKGLAGAFNSNLLEKTRDFIADKDQKAQINLILIGKKAGLFFNKMDYPIDRTFIELEQLIPDEELQKIADRLIQDYILFTADAVYIAYNEFKSILAPKVTITKVLPIEVPEQTGTEIPIKLEWEPGTEAFLNTLLPLFVSDQIRHFYYESLAAEYAARMMAMDNATRNAEDLVDDLTLVLNKMRQASITTELLEIMSAVEALAKN